MDTEPLLRHQLDQLGHQMRVVFHGLDQAGWNHRSYSLALTPHETAIHLADCYCAFMTALEGGDYAWESFRPEGDSPESALQALWQKRDEAIAKIDWASQRALKLATDFIVLHDAYHVGQMVSNRRSSDESFDYSKLYSG